MAFSPLGLDALKIRLKPMLGRVTGQGVRVHVQPDLDSPTVVKKQRDEIVALLEEISSPDGPLHNPRWYRLDEGYIHSAYIQRVDDAHLNAPVSHIPGPGILGEITVPFTQSMYKNRQGYWIDLYRLYFGSVHWITAVEETQPGEVFYCLTDEWLRIDYKVPAEHVRPIPIEEYAPFENGQPAASRRLEISIKEQILAAYEGDDLVREARISTGKRYMETPRGEFRVNRKYPSKHMGNGGLTSDPRAYELPGVPWVSFFTDTGIAFHGTYWHDNFGEPTSHGCVNLRSEDALWLFRWTTPAYISQGEAELPTWKTASRSGTPVFVE